jgi:hypothetical protein
MWLAMTGGWFSVVVDAQNAGIMLVRARCGVDIENYRDHHTALPSMTEPTSDEAARLSLASERQLR